MYYSLEKREFVNTDNFCRLDYKNHIVYYAGLLYLAHGEKAGKQSIDIIMKEYESKNIQFQNIYGSYVIIIVNKEDKNILMFSDNSHMSTIFYSDRFIGDNFLEMAGGIENPKLKKKLICEYLTLTRGYYFETFIKGIRMLRSSKYYEVKNGKIFAREKNIGYLGDMSNVKDIPSFFEDMAKSLSDQKVVAALTGGYDSRTVVACLNKKLDFELFISGNNESSREIKLSKEAAKSMGKKLKILSPDMASVDKEEVLWKSFVSSGGRACYNSSGVYRINYFQEELERQGYEVLLTGEAGETYKDFWCKQMFPFYYRRHTNTNLFYLTRMETVNNSIFLGKSLCKYYNRQKEDIVVKIHKKHCKEAVRSFDKYGYIINWEKSTFCHAIGCSMVAYAPLQELELVKYSFLQPIHLKYLNGLQRRVISEQSPELARILTTNGTNASMDKISLLRDSLVECAGQARRLARGIKRKFGDREKAMAKVMLEDDSDLRELRLSRKALEYCQRAGYINRKLKLEDIPVTLLYRIIYLYQLAESLDDKNERIC